MAKTKGPKAAEVVFEGVLIPNGTRSARLASKGISTIDEMGDFLTAVFRDTLNGKIVLPRTAKVQRKALNGLEQKLNRGLPLRMKGKGLGIKRPRRAKVVDEAPARTTAGPLLSGDDK
jgi:hypothetical protein